MTPTPDPFDSDDVRDLNAALAALDRAERAVVAAIKADPEAARKAYTALRLNGHAWRIEQAAMTALYDYRERVA